MSDGTDATPPIIAILVRESDGRFSRREHFELRDDTKISLFSNNERAVVVVGDVTDDELPEIERILGGLGDAGERA